MGSCTLKGVNTFVSTSPNIGVRCCSVARLREAILMYEFEAGLAAGESREANPAPTKLHILMEGVHVSLYKQGNVSQCNVEGVAAIKYGRNLGVCLCNSKVVLWKDWFVLD